MKKILVRFLPILMALTIICLYVPLSGLADESTAQPLQVKDQAGAVVQPQENAYVLDEAGGAYTVSGKGNATISVTAENVKLTLDNVSLDNAATKSGAVIAGKNTELIVKGTCSVVGGTDVSAISVPSGASLIVRGASGKDGDDSLIVTANGKHACAIGDYNCGTITVKQLHELTATGGCYISEWDKDSSLEGGCAIGGGHDENHTDSDVTISDCGTVTCFGGSKSTAIGSTYWKTADVLIENVDNLKAVGGATAAAIGTSRNNMIGKCTVTIRNSHVEALGGYYGSGIGSGYYDRSIGDYTRKGCVNAPIPEVDVSIEDGSTVASRGGYLASGIGGGYKGFHVSVAIEKDCKVAAYAGGNRDNKGNKVACGIGSGADGSGLFADTTATVSIEKGADVTSFSYGYTNELLSSKWAVSREMKGEDTTANVMTLRMLTSDFFKEGGDGHTFFDGTNENELKILGDNAFVKTIAVPAGYSCVAATLPEQGSYAVQMNGVAQSFLPTISCKATTDGAATGIQSKAYEHGKESDDAAYSYEYTYLPYRGSDNVTLSYSMDKPTGTFEVQSGVNYFDAVCGRPEVASYEPKEVKDPVEDNPDKDIPGDDTPKQDDPSQDVPDAEKPDENVPDEDTPLDEPTVPKAPSASSDEEIPENDTPHGSPVTGEQIPALLGLAAVLGTAGLLISKRK